MKLVKESLNDKHISFSPIKNEFESQILEIINDEIQNYHSLTEGKIKIIQQKFNENKSLLTIHVSPDPKLRRTYYRILNIQRKLDKKIRPRIVERLKTFLNTKYNKVSGAFVDDTGLSGIRIEFHIYEK